jgi:hypothetical protein
MIHTIKVMLFGERPKVHPPLRAGEHISAVPTERPSFNEWAKYIRAESTRMKR